MKTTLLCILGLAGHPGPSPAGGAALRVERTIVLEGVVGRFDHLAVDPEAERLYVVALGNDSLEVVDLVQGRRVESVAGLARPTGIALDPKTGAFVVASSREGCCLVYGRDLDERARVAGLDDADNVRFEAKTGRYLVGFGRALGIFTPSSEDEPLRVDVGGHPESFQLDPASDRVFVNVPDRRAVVVVDRGRGAVLASWNLDGAGGNFPMALDPADHRLIVGCRRPSRLLILDSDSGDVVASVPCAADADDLFYDGRRRRVYVSCGAGRIDVFDRADADHYALSSSVETAPGARTCLFDAARDRLYLAVPRTDGRPAEIRVFEVGP